MMRDTHSLDVEWDPVLVGAATTAIVGALALIVVQKPFLLFPASALGGGAAGLRGGYYSRSAIDGVHGVALGFLVLFPAIAWFTAIWLRGVVVGADPTVGTFLFLGVLGGAVELAVVGPLFLLLGFLGGAAAGSLTNGPEGSVTID